MCIRQHNKNRVITTEVRISIKKRKFLDFFSIYVSATHPKRKKRIAQKKRKLIKKNWTKERQFFFKLYLFKIFLLKTKLKSYSQRVNI
jgi:hypothetical protein